MIIKVFSKLLWQIKKGEFILEKLIILFYIVCGGMGNTYVRHNILGVQTAYVFNMKNFLLEKIACAFILGWISIPVAIIHWFFTRNSKLAD